MQFSHMLLPCVTADVSSNANGGTTRFCLPYINGNRSVTAQHAMISLCCQTWFLAFLVNKSLATETRVRIRLHKGFVAGEDHQWWLTEKQPLNEHLSVAATITKDGTDVMYIYDGGRTLEHNNVHVLGALVVICKNWSWAALVHAAARVVALTGNNTLGPLEEAFMTWKEEDDKTTSMTSPIPSFITKCHQTYQSVNIALNRALDDIDKGNYTERLHQSYRINEVLVGLKRLYRQQVEDMLHPEWE